MAVPSAELPSNSTTDPSTIPQLLDRWSRLAPHGPVPGFDRSPVEIVERIRELASAMIDRAGIDRPVVAYRTPAGIDGALLFLAAASIGTAAPMRPDLTEGEEARALDLIRPDLHLTDGTAGLGTITTKVLPSRSSGDPALLLTTSGTTGRPKRVGLDQRRLTTSATNIARWFRLTPDDRALTLMPLFHIHGLVAGTLAPIAGGGWFTPVRFDAFGFGSQIVEVRPTWSSAVPSMWELILTRWRDRPDDLRVAPWRFLRTSSSALSPALMSELEAVFGVPVIEAYGMTEAAHQIAANPLPPGERHPGSVGLGTGDIQIRISNPDATGEGQIEIRGSTVIDGYLDGESPDSFRDGWLATGDDGRLVDGRLVITGRRSEFINRGGDKISPHEIEATLRCHPDVRRVAAFPLRHAVLGQVPGVAVVIDPESGVHADDLRQHLAGRLSRSKRPARLEIVEEIPLGPTGKLQRARLAELLGWV
jgi:acyl-CoA synthetase (AMP-forming)/AMP-acid ligase II